jgi:hypothetical protein
VGKDHQERYFASGWLRSSPQAHPWHSLSDMMQKQYGYNIKLSVIHSSHFYPFQMTFWFISFCCFWGLCILQLFLHLWADNSFRLPTGAVQKVFGKCNPSNLYIGDDEDLTSPLLGAKRPQKGEVESKDMVRINGRFIYADDIVFCCFHSESCKP